jgi:ankyrin repeat protein
MRNKFFQTVMMLCFLSMSVFADAQEDFFTACMQSDLDGVKKAIKEGADVNALNSSKQNGLTSAFFSPEIIKYLLEKGCDPNGGNYPALLQACTNYCIETAEILLKAGADPNKKGIIDPSDTFRMLVAKEKAKGDDANEALIKAWSANIGKLPTSEISALQLTVQQTNCVQILKLLIDNGVKADFGYFYQYTGSAKAAFCAGQTNGGEFWPEGTGLVCRFTGLH